jgi:hypothetical protein
LQTRRTPGLKSKPRPTSVMRPPRHCVSAPSILIGVGAAILLIATDATSQTTTQLWTNVTLDWVKGDRLTYEIDIEPKTLISAPPDQPGWTSVEVTSTGEVTISRWMDVLGEIVAGRTKQTDDLDTTELTARVGVRLHLFSRDLFGEHLPKRRFVIRGLVRVESRNFFYSNDASADSTVRFRNRIEMLYPINRGRIGDDGALYVQADWEKFIPLNDPQERFANRERIRAGIGFRASRAWRFAALYIRNRSRDTTSDAFMTTDHVADFQIKRLW